MSKEVLQLLWGLVRFGRSGKRWEFLRVDTWSASETLIYCILLCSPTGISLNDTLLAQYIPWNLAKTMPAHTDCPHVRIKALKSSWHLLVFLSQPDTSASATSLSDGAHPSYIPRCSQVEIATHGNADHPLRAHPTHLVALMGRHDPLRPTHKHRTASLYTFAPPLPTLHL